MSCNPNLRALAVHHEALKVLAEDRPTLTMHQALEALTWIATVAASNPPSRGTIRNDARAIIDADLIRKAIPPFD